MALILTTTYPSQANAADADYPQGSGKNDVVAGDQSGTPFDNQWFNDIWGFLNYLIAYAAITPSGNPDTAQVSQYAQGLIQLIEDTIANEAAAGSLDARINTVISQRLQVVGGVLKYDANNNGNLDG